jgi:hypothetical protein
MRLKTLGVLVIFLSGVATLAADEVKGKIKSLDGAKGRLVLTVDGKDQILFVSRATKFLDADSKELDGGVDNKAIAQGVEVVVTFDKPKNKRPPSATEIKLSKK